jgi:hypothetical protein
MNNDENSNDLRSEIERVFETNPQKGLEHLKSNSNN